MSIRPEYFTYLEHFGKTVPVRKLYEDPSENNLVALRHDVDYDLDLALEMGYREHREGVASTYYLLHSAPYWSDPGFHEKCLQLQDFGHEVGFHMNVLAEWISGRLSDVTSGLEKLLIPLREAGVRISGVSAHGDRACYEKQFLNYWCFSELRPPDPWTAESGFCAEGIPVADSKFQIRYPQSHRLVRTDGTTFDLWSVSMRKLEIDYDASHVPHDSYFTDSGGAWERSDDPMKHDLSTGRHIVLMHPLYWRGLQKVYFFLSTARSGSKWIANFLDKATPLTARHEFSLNHRLNNGVLEEDKRTADGFTALVGRKDEARSLLLDICNWVSDIPGDYAEANVYLERFLPIVEELFHDATLIHLHRDPRDVVRSIMNRNWYDTPEDDRHPVMETDKWDSLDQFQKACWYVRKTNESLLRSCQSCISFEQMISDLNYLTEKLVSAGIPVFPRLAASEFRKKINANYSYKFPAYADWTVEQKEKFHSICDPVNKVLGYEEQGLQTYQESSGHELVYNRKSYPVKLLQGFKDLFDLAVDTFIGGGRDASASIDFRTGKFKSFSLYGCRISAAPEGLGLIPEGGKKAYFLIGGGKWKFLGRGCGWKAEAGHYYRGALDADIGQEHYAMMYCLMYDIYGRLIGKRSLGRIKQRSVSVNFSFKVRGEAKRFNIAVYMAEEHLPDKIILRGFKLESVPLSE